MATTAVMVLVTSPSAEQAAALARSLVEEGLAACGNVLPGVRSIYRWEGAVCDEPEALLVLKTERAAFEALRARVVALHPYQCPEVIALPIEAGHSPYLAWIASNVVGAD
jgi:periplasmic divalent cation tolerance protein